MSSHRRILEETDREYRQEEENLGRRNDYVLARRTGPINRQPMVQVVDLHTADAATSFAPSSDQNTVIRGRFVLLVASLALAIVRGGELHVPCIVLVTVYLTDMTAGNQLLDTIPIPPSISHIPRRRFDPHPT